jgi:hypothetical protein
MSLKLDLLDFEVEMFLWKILQKAQKTLKKRKTIFIKIFLIFRLSTSTLFSKFIDTTALLLRRFHTPRK